tara:strand:+ start:482 stop:862 length:381 start_codon:yes stop_codon:yes gene_type:complete
MALFDTIFSVGKAVVEEFAGRDSEKSASFIPQPISKNDTQQRIRWEKFKQAVDMSEKGLMKPKKRAEIDFNEGVKNTMNKFVGQQEVFDALAKQLLRSGNEALILRAMSQLPTQRDPKKTIELDKG